MLSIRTCVENNDDVRIKPNGVALIFIVGSKEGSLFGNSDGPNVVIVVGFKDGLYDGPLGITVTELVGIHDGFVLGFEVTVGIRLGLFIGIEVGDIVG